MVITGFDFTRLGENTEIKACSLYIRWPVSCKGRTVYQVFLKFYEASYISIMPCRNCLHMDCGDGLHHAQIHNYDVSRCFELVDELSKNTCYSYPHLFHTVISSLTVYNDTHSRCMWSHRSKSNDTCLHILKIRFYTLVLNSISLSLYADLL